MSDIPFLQIQSDRELAISFAEDAADGLVAEGNCAVWHARQMLEHLRMAGLKASSMDALRDALSDAFGDLQGAINRTLDERGIHEDQFQIDVSGL